METFKGIAVSPGLAIGQVFVLDDVRTRIPRRTVASGATGNEKKRLAGAIEGAQKELVSLSAQAAERLGSESAKIFDFHQLMLRDRSLTQPIEARIENEKVTAEYAVQEQFKVLAEMFRGMSDATFRTKVDDVWDLERRLLKHLIGEHTSALDRLDRPAVVIARDLTPSQTAAFQGKPVKGFATDLGGLTSHTAIFARALQIPAIVGLGSFSEIAEDGDPVIVDGERGVLILKPDEHTLAGYHEAIEIAERDARALESIADLPAETTDGTRIFLMGNIEFADEMGVVIEQGGDGVGLFRTEFLWLTSDHEPTEDEQYAHYKRCLDLAQGREVTFRTFDLGADKYTQERALDPERNPFLGCRSIRYCLQNVPMFKRQLRAILRASVHGSGRIMFPLITSDLELRQAKIILKDVMEDLDEEGIAYDARMPIGMMVETPAAALMAGSYVGEVNFFSIGTNDLIQYTLAVDRTNDKVQNLYSAAHPAVLRLVKDVIRAGRRHDIPVSLCGEVAGDIQYTLLLMGLGLRTLSVTPSRLPYLKRIVRSVDITTCERLARTACSFESERQVTAYLRDQARKIIPETFGGRSADPGFSSR